MAGVTDNLIKLARECFAATDPTRTRSFARHWRMRGERAESQWQSTPSVAALFSLTGAEAGILTDRVHSKAKIANISRGKSIIF
jgi:aspartate kinase